MSILRVNKIAASGQTSENTGSVFFDGTGDYLSVQSSTDFDFGTGDFTIELYANLGNLTNRNIFARNDSNPSNTGILLWQNNSGYLEWYSSVGNNTGVITVNPTPLAINSWSHISVSRKTNTTRLFVNGVQVGSVSDNTNISGSSALIVGSTFNGNVYFLRGFISNLRIVKGKALYTSNFTPPTTELEVTPETVLVACYDGENIFAEKTGKIIAAYGDRLSSPTPTATDSPIGITTFQPGLTRSVDVTSGPVLQGNLEYNSQNFLVLPKGTTEERMPVFGGVQSGTRGIFAGAYAPARSSTIEYITISTLGNTTNFGNLTAPNGGTTGYSDSTRGWVSGGNIAPTFTNNMEYVTISSTGNAVDGGDLMTVAGGRPGSVANSIRGIIAGGVNPGYVNTMQYHTIQTTGNVQDFGDLTAPRAAIAGVMSPTRGVFAGGRQSPSVAVDTIDHITMSSTGNAVVFGELSLDDRWSMGGASNTVRGLFGGGRSPTDHAHIEYITIATLGNAQDFGDLTQSGMDGDVGAVSSSTRVVFGGGASDELGYVEIATLGNTTAFGKFTVNTTANQDPGCFSNGHGGLG